MVLLIMIIIEYCHYRIYKHSIVCIVIDTLFCFSNYMLIGGKKSANEILPITIKKLIWEPTAIVGAYRPKREYFIFVFRLFNVSSFCLFFALPLALFSLSLSTIYTRLHTQTHIRSMCDVSMCVYKCVWSHYVNATVYLWFRMQ